ncbi:MAG: hypothetical protein MZU97_18640 [Bacillus subtilis]|nr:hypothetical protein [Bacillus subtilis]
MSPLTVAKRLARRSVGHGVKLHMEFAPHGQHLRDFGRGGGQFAVCGMLYGCCIGHHARVQIGRITPRQAATRKLSPGFWLTVNTAVAASRCVCDGRIGA